MATVNLSPLLLTQAELAAIYQGLGLLGPAGGDGQAVSQGLADMGVTPGALAAAQARLVERGVLRTSPTRAPAVTLAPELQAIFATVSRPRMLCVLQSRQPGSGERRASFSWTPEALVVNTQDAQGNHRLEPLPGLAAVAERALSESGVDAAALASNPPAVAPADPETLAQRATHRALFLMVAQAGSPRAATEALSWLVSDGQLWLIAARGGASGAATLAAIDRPALQALLSDRVARGAG